MNCSDKAYQLSGQYTTVMHNNKYLHYMYTVYKRLKHSLVSCTFDFSLFAIDLRPNSVCHCHYVYLSTFPTSDMH